MIQRSQLKDLPNASHEKYQAEHETRDRWQVTRNLTINIGLRYEFYPLMTRAGGKGIERLDPETNQVFLGGRGNVPTDVGITVSHKLFSPRVGIAYRLSEKTVVRTGAFQRALDVAAEHVGEALTCLEGAPQGPARDSLERLTRLIIDRVPVLE